MFTNTAGLVLGMFLATAIVAKAPAQDPQMPPEMQEMMKKAEIHGKPGANHKVLDNFVGKWNHTSKSWMKPGDQPMESKGTSEHTWVLDGRFLKQKAEGDWAGKKFEGIGFTGYDNVRGEYQSIWMDNMMTGIMKVAGTYDRATKTIKQGGTFSCPMTGEKDMWFRSEWKVINKNKNIYTMYQKDKDGKEFKGMELIYTRVQ